MLNQIAERIAGAILRIAMMHYDIGFVPGINSSRI
jgi:hypothetical protein